MKIAAKETESTPTKRMAYGFTFIPASKLVTLILHGNEMRVVKLLEELGKLQSTDIVIHCAVAQFQPKRRIRH